MPKRAYAIGAVIGGLAGAGLEWTNAHINYALQSDVINTIIDRFQWTYLFTHNQEQVSTAITISHPAIGLGVAAAVGVLTGLGIVFKADKGE